MPREANMGPGLKEWLKRESASELGLNLVTSRDGVSPRWQEPEVPDVPEQLCELVACHLLVVPVEQWEDRV